MSSSPEGMAMLSALLKNMYDRLRSATWDELALVAVGEELDRLRTTLYSIRAVLQEDATLMTMDGPLVLWLRNLRDAAYDADDVVDELEYEVVRLKVEDRAPAVGFRGVRAFPPRLCLPAPDRDFVKRIQMIRKRLDHLAWEGLQLGVGKTCRSGDPADAMDGGEVDFASAAEASAYSSSGDDIETQITHCFSSSDDESPRSLSLLEKVSLSTILGGGPLGKGKPVFNRVVASTSLDRSVLGREQDVEKLVQLLMGPGDEAYYDGPAGTRIIPIVGMGGIGKTTLAQLVYQDPRITEYFHLRIWTCVSLDFDVRRLIIQMLDDASSMKHDLFDFASLQNRLKEVLEGKRFLLVLDDVWNEDRSMWEKLRRPLLGGGKGSAVLVTTRSAKVAQVMSPGHPYSLTGLTDEDCWQLLADNAFAGEDPRQLPNLVMISRSIATKCKGLPLAAKVVGAILHSTLGDTHWEQILGSELWELKQSDKQAEDVILPVLRLCYRHLPANLKSCFVYCSVLPKDHVFEKATLVQIWMAQGFIEQQGMKTMEEQGSEYFDSLVCCSFFRHFGDGFVMHDLVHDLAVSVARDEYLRIEHDNFPKMSENFHHVSLCSFHLLPSDYENLYKLKRLRTLLFLHRSKRGIQHISHDLFSNLKCMRVLDLSYGGLEHLPDSIGLLRHLRYLNLSYNIHIESLPDSLSLLLSLQTLKITGCQKLKALPVGMSTLVNLRHLQSDPEPLLSISGVGRLTSLQELPQFKVSRRKGHKIVELRDLSGVRGALCICKLENVENMTEATMAMLNKKRHLSVLGLEWSPRNDDVTAKLRNALFDEQVLQGLQPHPNLRVLTIKGYDGSRSPTWMKMQLLPNLEAIVLQGCERWERLPPLGELTCLKFVRIEGLQRVRQLDREFHGNEGFPSLKELLLYDMNELEEWSGTVDGGLFPKLRTLEIKNCPKLMELPRIPVPMKLKIERVGLTELPDRWLSDAMAENRLPSLVLLRIADCSNLKFLTRKLCPYYLKALERLSLTGCKELEVLPAGWFGALQSLKHLTLKDCPKLKPPADGDCDLPPSLVNLNIEACPGVVDGALCRSVQSLLSCSSVVRKHYPDLTSCAEEVLHHLIKLQMLNLYYHDGPSPLLQAQVLREYVNFTYVVAIDRGRHGEAFMPSKVDLEVRGQCNLNSTMIATVVCFLQSLKFLQISGFPTLRALPLDVLWHVTSLQSLIISNCKDLVSLVLQPLCSLVSLRVEDCPELTHISVDKVPTTLKVLIAISCCSLESLPSELELFTSLEYLHIENCTQMRMLPNLPTSLKELVIEECPHLDLLEQSKVLIQTGTGIAHTSHMSHADE